MTIPEGEAAVKGVCVQVLRSAPFAEYSKVVYTYVEGNGWSSYIKMAAVSIYIYIFDPLINLVLTYILFKKDDTE